MGLGIIRIRIIHVRINRDPPVSNAQADVVLFSEDEDTRGPGGCVGTASPG